MLTSKTRVCFLSFLLDLFTPSSVELIFYTLAKVDIAKFWKMAIEIFCHMQREKLWHFRQCLTPINVGFPRNGKSRDKNISLSRFSFVPGQGQEQKSRDKFQSQDVPGKNNYLIGKKMSKRSQKLTKILK